MDNFEVKHSLETMKILIDTREKPSELLKARLDIIGLPYERRKLDVGDYSCSCILPDGSELDFSQRCVIERKYDLSELCMCFGKERGRFSREFERAKASDVKIYLLVENATWEKIYAGKYNSLFTPAALEASIDAFRSRYNMQIDFCKAEITGKRIHDILYRELKEYLESGGADGTEIQI